jgi:hypothetical protein
VGRLRDSNLPKLGDAWTVQGQQQDSISEANQVCFVFCIQRHATDDFDEIVWQWKGSFGQISAGPPKEPQHQTGHDD